VRVAPRSIASCQCHFDPPNNTPVFYRRVGSFLDTSYDDMLREVLKLCRCGVELGGYVSHLFDESKDIWHHSSRPKLHDTSPRRLAATATERKLRPLSHDLRYHRKSYAPRRTCRSRLPPPTTSTQTSPPRPQPCSVSPPCNRGSWPHRSSTLRLSYPPPSCFGKAFQ
jgi:hypothetical protein